MRRFPAHLSSAVAAGALALAGCHSAIGQSTAEETEIVDAPAPEPTSSQLACEALNYSNFETGADHPFQIIEAKYQPAGPTPEGKRVQLHKRSMSQGMPAYFDTLPDHCEISGYIAPNIEFLMMLPSHENWNNKTLYAACDAFCGEVQYDMPVPGMAYGFATMASDGGHRNKRPFDGIWGYNNREGEIDFGFRATHLSAQAIKAVATEYYGEAPGSSYTAGFSKGGTSGIKAALTYPEDFDGIMARSPVVRYQDINAIRLPWIYQTVTREDGAPILLARDASIVHASVIAACDGVDGLEDGVIADPHACTYDPAVLLCSEEAGDKACLTAEQVDVVRRMYAPPTNADGEEIYPYPLNPGSELDWPRFHLPVSPGERSFVDAGGSTWLRYLAFEEDPGPDYDWASFDPISEADKLDDLRWIYDATDPDLSAFRDAGGKMIVLHGWGDGAVNARMTIDWYESVQVEMGETSDFLKLYVIPGNKHGAGGDGPDLQESMTALVNWVETGEAPYGLVLRKEVDKEIVRTRPTYPWPMTTVYDGEGDIYDAASYGPSSQ
ncbi:MAG: tannase/feruloyl esterase family alpha/beta hydrolase [Hyphomonadaceae bacterium]|nr:tannase/feruloyl esterase family alpha/beta hydrolase [Hyphomonadaceae bacterium]